MVRTSPWPTVLGTAALIALPVLAVAQTGSTGTQSSQPTTQSDKAYPSTAGAATHHLTEAKQVLDSIPRNAVTGRNAAKLNQIRREFAALQRTYSANPSGTSAAKTPKASKGTASASGSWNTHLMALDRDLSALLGSSSAASTETAAPGATGATGTSGSTTASGALETGVRSKLEEFRTHITQFAAAASGTSASGTMSSSASTGSTGSMTGTEPTTTTPTEPTTTSPTTSSATNPTQTGSATGETAQPTQSAQTSTSTSAQADTAAAKQHLTEARQALADLTALPQAQQLQGETRTQVSQLISQFNQLITTQVEWRSSYDQVNATLTALLGSSASATSSTQGAVGTSGSTAASGAGTLDPALRSKLEEFRTHLQAFYTAAGGQGAASASQPTSGSMGSAGSMGSTGSTTSTGSTSAAGSMSSQTSTGTSGSIGSTSASGDVESHIAAIERILDQAGAGAGASSSSTGSMSGTKASGNVTLTQEQLDQIRMHLQAIRNSAKK